MSDTLMHCPFCGKTDPVGVFLHSEIEEIEIEEEDDYYAVCCAYEDDGCGATGGYRETEEEAIEVWNTRAPLDLEVAE